MMVYIPLGRSFGEKCILDLKTRRNDVEDQKHEKV